MNIAILGCGNIAPHYLDGLARLAGLKPVACADLDRERARQFAAEHKIPAALAPAELFDSRDVDLVINLTSPAAHFETTRQAIAAGKHVFCEKPLTATPAEARQLQAAAAAAGVVLGGAPDCFLSPVSQTARRLIDEGAIGQPLAALGVWANRGPERWHPQPEIFYRADSGPLFDTGPYPVVEFIHLFGPVARVTGSGATLLPQRVLGHPSRRGQTIAAACQTHVSFGLSSRGGGHATFVVSFDLWHHTAPLLEIYGTEGSLSLPSFFSTDKPLRLRGATDADWREIRPDPLPAYGRGIGVVEMIEAIRHQRPPAASAALAGHVVEILCGIQQAARTGAAVVIESSCARPAPWRAVPPAPCR